MAYATWSVVAGEQPTAAKWNILGTNDASFNDGTGIANNAILNAHIATGNLYASKFYNPYKCNAYAAGATTLGNATWTKAALDSKDYDTSSNFNTSLNRFVAPVAGFYAISGQAAITLAGSSTGAQQNAIYKNGATLINGTSIAASGNGSTINRGNMSRTVSLAANDYIEVFGFVGEAGRSIDSGIINTFLSVFLVSAT